jgi:riboflavin kinase/FMN adenylyltransferase
MDVFRSMDELGAGLSGPVVLTVGFFDGLHRGHRLLLDQLATGARRLNARSLAITFTNSPRGYHYPDKQYPYLTMPEEKLWLLSKTDVDAVLMVEYDASIAARSAAEFLSGLGERIELAGLCSGYDSRLGHDQIAGREAYQRLAAELGIELVFVEALAEDGQPVKSRRARELVRRGRVAEARAFLDHPYFVLGPVVHGKGKGARALNVATANLELPPRKLAPPTGVYACRAEVNGLRYPAAVCVMTAILHQSTALEHGELPGEEVAGDRHSVVEAHLIGYDGNLYGQALRIDFIEYLRAWIDFETPAALHDQIEADIAATLARLLREPELLEAGHG